MKIRVDNLNVCLACRIKKCSYIDSVEKPEFIGLKTEATVCPFNVLRQGPEEKIDKNGYINSKDCTGCALCVEHCPHNNLKVENYVYDESKLSTNSDPKIRSMSELQENALAMSYLNNLFEFAANTNRNKAYSFDGLVFLKSGECSFVEVDSTNDSLECCRRLIRDIVMFNSKHSRNINNGILVLSNFPKEGSQDIYQVLNSLHKFPKTKNFSFYITTFNFLKYTTLYQKKENYDFSLFYNPVVENETQYKNRLSDLLTTPIQLDEIFA